MYTEKDLRDCEYFYDRSIRDWVVAKGRWLNNISWLKENKKHLSLKKYNKLKHLTKQTRIELQQAIETSFQEKIETYNKLREVQNYLASKQHDQDNDLFIEVLEILNNMTQEQQAVFMKRKHEINLK